MGTAADNRSSAAADATRREASGILAHAAVYLAARGVPGAVAFLAIPLFSRMLEPAQYGRYALAVATVGVLNALLFQWLRLSLVRFLPGAEDPKRLKSTLATVCAAVVGAVGLCGAAACLLPAAGEYRQIIALCWVTLAAQAAFELCCEYARSQLRPWYYMALQSARAVAFVGLGAAFVLAGAGWWGPLAGVAAGMLLASAVAWRRDWADASARIDRPLLGAVARYGVPLSLTVALTVVIATSDRYLLAALRGEAAAGLYAVAADFTTQTLTLLMMAINMAAFPVAVRAWERGGAAGARQAMRVNASLLLAVGVPSVAGLAVLAPGVAHVFFGPEFRGAAGVVPLVALGALLAGLKAYHFDAAFQFAHRTTSQVWIVAVAAALNVALILAAVPRWGIYGAAGASVLAYGVAIGLTALLGRRHVALPLPAGPSAAVLLAAAVMAALLYPFRSVVSAPALAAQVAGGALVYGAVLLACDFMRLRTRGWARLRAARPPLAPVAPAVPEAA
jgi:O-antigen/teichoic acid export membrane protein